jgi:hypothetical protein
MAAWQLDLLLIPLDSAKAHLDPQGGIDAESVEATDWWNGKGLPSSYSSMLGGLLPQAASWDAEWEVFGTLDGNRVDVLAEGGTIAEVRVRIDVRDPDLQLLEQLCTFAQEAKCVFLSPDGHVVEPTPEAIWVEIELSGASTFVRDPAGFLGRLRAKNNRP